MEENNFYLELLKDSNLVNIGNEEKEMIEIRLWRLLDRVIERYTLGDSSSVPVEVAEELLKSITFLLKKEMKNSKSKIDILKSEKLEELWKKSWGTIEKDIKVANDLVELVIKTSIEIGNISYEDTILGIKNGLRIYNYRFLAHEVPGTIDYQLSIPADEKLQGIDFINEYLKRLLFENKFCNNFEKEKIREILKSYCDDYKGLLINIFEVVITNVIGLELIGEDILKLEISSYEREKLLYIFRSLKKEEIEEKLINAVYNIAVRLKITDEFESNYMKKIALSLVIRIKEAINNNNLENIFLSYKLKTTEIENIFIANEIMENEKLIKLIDEIRVCRLTKDKIEIIHREVKSLDDLVEILNNCIWEDEVKELVNEFSEDEIEVLKYYLTNRVKNSGSNTGWENKFIEICYNFKNKEYSGKIEDLMWREKY